MGLPVSEKAIAFKILARSGVPMVNIPTNKVQLALKMVRKLKQGIRIALNLVQLVYKISYGNTFY